MTLATVSDYCCRKRVKYVVLGNVLLAKLVASPVKYLLSLWHGRSKNVEPLHPSLLFLLVILHGLLMVQRPETKLGMDFPDSRLHTRVTTNHHPIDFCNLGGYRKGLCTDLLPGKVMLDAASSYVVFRRFRCLLHRLTSRRWEDTRPARSEAFPGLVVAIAPSQALREPNRDIDENKAGLAVVIQQLPKRRKHVNLCAAAQVESYAEPAATTAVYPNKFTLCHWAAPNWSGSTSYTSRS